MKMPGTLGLLLPICVAAATLAVFIAIIVIKCYLNWKREHKKDYQELRLADGTVQHLVLSSQPIDFVPLLIQDRLEEEEELDEFDTCTSLTHCYISGASSEDISYEQTKNQTSSKVKVKSTVNQAILTENTVLQPRSQGISSSCKKRDSGNEERKVHPQLERLNSEASVLDRYGQRVNLRSTPRSTKRGESLFFDDGESFHSSEKSLLKRCYSAGAQSRPRRGSRTESLKSLSRESLSEDSTLPDPTPHMRKSVVSTVDTNLPKPKLTKQRKSSASEVSYANKGLARRKSHVPQKRGNVALKMTYSKDLHTLEVHLINATELPIRHGRMLDVFARLSLKTPSKRERFQSKVHKKTCNPIFDERFAFKSHRFSELKKARLKIKLFDRLGVSRYEPIGETVISLCDENVMRGDNMTRDLLAGKPQLAGELQLSLCHEATSSHLKVTVVKLKDLPKSIKSPSVAVELTHKGEILQKHQTKARKKDLTINEQFSFEVATNSSCTLENFGVQFTVFQHDFMRGNEVIGHVRLGLDAPFQSEALHWKAVVLSPHKPLQEWHKLHGPL